MGIETMGKRIAALRKERGVKQDELASFVGVSTQAVSKWENGGAPDIELLPKIADFFCRKGAIRRRRTGGGNRLRYPEKGFDRPRKGRVY